MILAGDFGGSILKLALVDQGVVLASMRIDSPARSNPEDWLPGLKEHFANLCQEAGMPWRSLEGMVWALPLVIHPGLHKATWGFGKFDHAIEESFPARVEAVFGLPMKLENDARAAAIGEWQAGAGRGLEDMVMITLGTGIGTAVILDGHPLRGRSGMAGILGGLSITHLGAPVEGKVAPGCIEGRCATWALSAQAARLPGFRESPLAGSGTFGYEEVFRHAAAGDPCARQLRDGALEAWSALALNLIQAYDPQRVIVGGGIMASGVIILPALRRFVEEHAVQAGGTVEIVPGMLGDHAALLGCEWIWNSRLEKNP